MNQTKAEFYRELSLQLNSLLMGEEDVIANLANASALLYQQLNDVNWAGFYFLKGNELVLGPFQGKPACVRIPMGKGVCGTAAAKLETIIVANVHEFEGHIACDIASNSEIVIPLTVDNTLLGVMDVDSASLNRFDQADQIGLEAIANIIEKSLSRNH